MQGDLEKCTEIINDYLLLSRRKVSRRNKLCLLGEKARAINSDDDYVNLYEEACVLREKFKWAKTDTPFYRKQLLRRPIIAVESVSQMKVCLGLKLCHGWNGKLKLCVSPPGLDRGLKGEIDDMKSFAREWGLTLEPNTSAELLEGYVMTNIKKADAESDLAVVQREAMQLPHNDEPRYAALAVEAGRLRKCIWVCRCRMRSIQRDVEEMA